MNSIIALSGVSFELSNGRELFQNLTFTLDDRLTALVGPNGIGKTTLAKLLTGELTPTTGTIRRKAAITFLAQREPPKPQTVGDYLGSEYTESILGKSLLEGIDRRKECTTLSGGQWMRVRLARTLDDRFLVLDEPTNDLDRNGRQAVLRFLRERSGGALLISHDRECLQLCESVLELSNRGLSKFGMGWPAYIDEKKRERQGLNKALERAKREQNSAIENSHEQRTNQEKRSRRGADAASRGGQAKILLGGRKSSAQVASGKREVLTLERKNKAVQSIHQALGELKVDPVMYAGLSGQEIPSQKLVAEARNFNISFDEWIYPSDLTFSWRGNIRMALKGENGSGKSTLLKAILGGQFKCRGELRRGNLQTLYIDQRCELLDDAQSIFDNVQNFTGLGESEVRSGLAQFLFMKEAVFQKVKDLSGGERLRAALAAGFLSDNKPELLVLDEPTNNLDLVNIEFLERLIGEFKGALIVISHDDLFLKNCRIEQEFAISAVSGFQSSS